MSRLRWVFSSSSSSVRIFSNSAMTAGHDRTNGACCELLGVTERGDARPTHYHDITHQLRAPAFIYMLAFTEQLTHVYASINPFNPASPPQAVFITPTSFPRGVAPTRPLCVGMGGNGRAKRARGGLKLATIPCRRRSGFEVNDTFYERYLCTNDTFTTFFLKRERYL
jgi:hypothetical protein